jgi:hypothetical protein
MQYEVIGSKFITSQAVIEMSDIQSIIPTSDGFTVIVYAESPNMEVSSAMGNAIVEAYTTSLKPKE